MKTSTSYLKQLAFCSVVLLAGLAENVPAASTYYWVGRDWTSGAAYGAYWSYNNNWSTSSGGSGLGSPIPSLQNYLNFDGSAAAPANGLYNVTNDFANGAGFQIYFKNTIPAAYNLYGTGNGITFYDNGGGANDPNIQNEGTTYTPTINFAITNGNNNGTYRILNINQNASPAQGPLTFNGPIYGGASDANSRVINIGGGNVTFNNTINNGAGGGTLALTLLGSGTVTLAATNTFTGDLSINAGTVLLATNSALPASTNFVRIGDTSGSAGANLNLNGGNNVSAPVNVRSGSSGTKIIANTSGTTGTATFAGGLYLDGDATLYANTGGNVALTGSTLDLKNQTLTVSGGGAAIISGPLTNSTGNGKLNLNGTGILTVFGLDTFAGSTTISGTGMLVVTNDVAFGAATNGIIFSASGVIAATNNGVAVNNTATIGSARTITVNASVGANFQTTDTNSLVVAAYITGAGGVTRKSSSFSLGAVRFNNDTNDYTGDFTANYGTTEFTSVTNQGTASSLGKGAVGTGGTITLGNSTSAGTLRYVGAASSATTRPLNWTATTGGYTLDVSGAGSVSYVGTGNLRSGTGGADTLTLNASSTGIGTLAQVINDLSGVTSVAKTGSGQWILSSPNTYSGNTTVSQGILQANANNTFGYGPIILTNSSAGGNAKLVFNSVTITNAINISVANAGTGAGVIQAVDNTSSTVSGTLTISSNAAAGGHIVGPTTTGLLTLSGPINVVAPATTLLVREGYVQFSGGGSYTNIDIRNRTNSIGANNGVATTAILEIGGNGSTTVPTVFDLNGFNQTLAGVKNSVTPANLARVANSSATLSTLTLAVSNTQVFNGSMTGNLAVNLTGGTQVYSNSPTSGNGVFSYTGDTTISGGTLKTAAANLLPNGTGKGNMIVTNTGTLDLNTFSQTVNGLSGSATVDTVAGGSPVLTVGGNSASSTFTGLIKNTAGSLSVKKSGSGTFTFTGTNTATGQVFADTAQASTGNDGVFKLAFPGALSGPTNIAIQNQNSATSTFQLDGTAGNLVVTQAVLINGRNTYSVPAIENLAGNNTLSGSYYLGVGGGFYEIQSDSGTLTNTGTLVVSTPGSTRILTFLGVGNHWISGTIQNGTGGGVIALTKDGSGTATLAGANTFTGDTRVTNGTLVINNTLALQNSSVDMNAADSGTLNLNNLNATLGGLKGARNLALGTGTVSVGNNGVVNTYSGSLSGNALTKVGTGALTLAGNNQHTGATTISAGELIGQTGGSISNNTVSVSAGATNGVLLASANGQWICGNLTFSSATSVADFNFNGLTPSTTTAPILVNTNLTFTATPVFVVRSTNGISIGQYPLIKYAGALSGTPPVLASFISPAGLGATISNNVANKSIDLVVTNGTAIYWAVGNAAWDINTTANWKDFSGTAEKYLDGDFITFDDTASGSSPITVTLGSLVTPAAITVNATNKSYTISGPSNFVGSATLIKNGTNSLTMAITNSGYTGTIIVNAGTLAVPTGSSLGGGSTSLIFNNNATYSIGSGGNSGTPGTPITVSSGATVTVTANTLSSGPAGSVSSADTTGQIIDTSSLSYGGSLSGFSGTLTISGGTTRLSAGSNGSTNLGSAAANFVINSTAPGLQPRNNNTTVNLGSLSGTGSLGGAQSLTPPSVTTYIVGALNTSTTFAGQLNDSPLTTNTVAMIKTGTGSLNLSSNSTMNGTVTVNSGALIGVTGGSISNSAVTVNAGATNGVNVTVAGGKFTCTNLTYAAGTCVAQFAFGVNSPSTTVAPLQVQNNLVINGTLNILVTGNNLAFSSGVYPLIKYGGTLTGSASVTPLALPLGVYGVITNDTANNQISLLITNVITPALVWQAGTSNWDFNSIAWTNGLAGMLTNWSDVNFLAQFDDTAAGSGPFTVTLATNVNPLAVLFTNSTKNYTLTGSGAVTGSGSLTKANSGTLTLLTTNTFTGGITVSGGTLQGNSSTLLGSIANSAALVFDQTFNGSNNAVISGAGTITKQNTGTVALGGNNTFTGNVNVNQGVLAIGFGANLGAARGAAVTNAITINGGTLQATNGLATITLPSNAGITVGASGATIDVASGITLDYPAQAISGTGALTKNGAGTFQMDEGTASSTFNGLTLNTGTIAFNKSSGGLGVGALVINGGLIRTTTSSSRSPNNPTIQVNADFTLGSPTTAAISFANGGAWTLANGNRTITVDTIVATITGAVGDGGNNLGLIKAGNGTLVLSSADTYTGPTTISAGYLKLANNLAAGTNSITSAAMLQLANGVFVTNAFTANQTFECMDVPDAGATATYGGVAGNSGNGFRFYASGSGATLIFSNATVNITTSGKTFWPTRGNIVYAGNTVINNNNTQSLIGRSAGNPASLTIKDNVVCNFSAFSVGYDTGNNNTTLNLTIQDSAAMNLGTGSFNTLASSITGAGTINLNGGTITAGSITKSVTGTAMALNWNGGTIKAASANASFFPALTGLTATVSTNGGTLNDNGFNITVAQPLTHDSSLGATADGGLTKSGAGITTLSGANTYTGPTTISAGTLLLTGSLGTNALTVNSVLNGTGTVNGPTTVNFGGTLQAGLGGVDTSTLNISNALALAGNALFNLDRTNAQTANKVSGLTSVTYGGTLTVTNLGPALQAGDSFTLFAAASYSGGFTNLVLPSLTAGLGWNTNNLAVNGTLAVVSLLGVAVAPVSTNVTYGTSVTLTANVTGTGPFTYQWFDNATNAISGQTNSTLTLTAPAVAASGNYTVVVGNLYGSATNSASVTVSVAPLSITADNDTKTYGQTKVYGSGSTNFTSIGLQNGETVGSVTIIASGGTNATDAVGGYTLVPSAATGGTFNPANYSLTYSNGTLTVNALAVVLGGTRAYDTTTTAAAGILTVANKAGSDDVNVASGSATLAGAGVGAQAIVSLGTLALGGTTAGNYTLTGATGSVTVTAASTATAVVSSSSPAGYLDALVFTANVTPTNATGSVTFSANGTPFSTNTLVAGAVSSSGINSLARGTNSITAAYSGDANYSASSAGFSQIVTNHTPVAGNPTYSRYAGVTSLRITVSDLLTNVTDADGDTITLVSVGSSTNGVTLTLGGGLIGYFNTNNVNDQFSYTVTDGYGGTNTGTVSIAIVGSYSGQVTGAINSFTGGTANLTFYGIPTYPYVTERSTNLTDWVEVQTNNAGTNGVINSTDAFNDLGGVPPASAYYRLRWQAP
jgi:fibronectin-binding autotransporter adhesin